jgi:hypothetical protein
LPPTGEAIAPETLKPRTTGECKGASDVGSFLEGVAGELVEFHRGTDDSLWRGEAKHRVDRYLAEAESFSAFVNCWVFSGDLPAR